MTKLTNIIQRRELEPLFLKALKIVKHYEKAANCAASVMGPDWENSVSESEINSICKHYCGSTAQASGNNTCSLMHLEAVKEARRLGGAYIYVCPAGFVFWTSPFYSGERFAGALFSGGIQGSKKNSSKVKALAQMMLVCADQISGMSYGQKNIPFQQTFISDSLSVSGETENNAYPMDMERMLLAGLRRGDTAEAKKILKKLLNTLNKELEGNLPGIRLKAMELAVVLSRAAANPEEIKNNATLDANHQYFKKIEESSSLEKITEILSIIIERISGNIFSFHGVRHFSALRKAERFIWENYTKKISLQEIADASGLSAPYFSTIFREEMGENLSNYLNRLRIEKAAAMLITTNIPINEVAAYCGFQDQSWFSKIFRKNTGFTPGKYREQGSF